MGHWQCSILDVNKFWSEPWLLGTLIELDQVFVFLWHYKTSAPIPNIWTSLEVIWYDHVLISETFSSDSNLSRTVFKKGIDYPTGQQMPLVRATWRNWGHSVIVEPFSKIIITQVFFKTRPKPAYGRQGLEWDRWVRIQFRRVHFGVDTFWENTYFWKKISLI